MKYCGYLNAATIMFYAALITLTSDLTERMIYYLCTFQCKDLFPSQLRECSPSESFVQDSEWVFKEDKLYLFRVFEFGLL